MGVDFGSPLPDLIEASKEWVKREMPKGYGWALLLWTLDCMGKFMADAMLLEGGMSDDRFKYHAPTDEAKDMHEEIRGMAEQFTEWVEAVIPVCRERSLALTKIEEAMFWANAAVARQVSAKEAEDGG